VGSVSEERKPPQPKSESLEQAEPVTGEPTAVLLVEFDGVGFSEVAKKTPDELARESAAAVARAMGTIREMGERVAATVDSMSLRPTTVEVTFGIRLDAEAGAIIAKVSGGASLEVRLAWELAAVDEHDGSA
jgi:Trypsin-co-occurring domain 1